VSAGGDVGLLHYRRLFEPIKTARASLDRASLPTPLRYLADAGLLTGRTRAEWATIRCPAHKGGDERHPSMSVSLADGHFRCHACGAKGGDLIALHRLRTGASFRQAVAELGGRFHE
jgi:hypothetical protein